MHPAVADCSLHISAVPEQATNDIIPARIPVSLAALAAPERRNAVVRMPWAFSAASKADSGGPSNGEPVTGDMAVVETGEGQKAKSQNWMRFRGLVSRGVASPGRQQGRGAAAQAKVSLSQCW
jgi:hypothetical protein